LRQYVDYQEEASYKIEKLERASNGNSMKSSSKFNIKTGKNSKKDTNYEKNDAISVTKSNFESNKRLDQMELIQEQEAELKIVEKQEEAELKIVEKQEEESKILEKQEEAESKFVEKHKEAELKIVEKQEETESKIVEKHEEAVILKELANIEMIAKQLENVPEERAPVDIETNHNEVENKENNSEKRAPEDIETHHENVENMENKSEEPDQQLIQENNSQDKNPHENNPQERNEIISE
jgi:hypothetical protein